ncbi:hypothetical protein KMM349_01800 [Stenotrophomonas maltophilia]|nr:hypothetical protein KMM349_01800 [Stenotrophomonas maltophilia]
MEKPARNNASAVRRKAGVPCWMRVSAMESTVEGRPSTATTVSPVMGSMGRWGGRAWEGTGLRLGPSIQSIHNLIGQD